MYVLKRMLIVLLIAALAVGGYFGYNILLVKQAQDESSWQTVSGTGFSIKAPKSLKDGGSKSTNVAGVKNKCFYTSRLVGFDVNFHEYDQGEKLYAADYTAEDFADLMGLITSQIKGFDITFLVRDGKNYLYAQGHREIEDHVGKSDDIWYIMAAYPTPDGYYIVDAYCSMDEKGELQDYLFKMLDSFTVK